MGGTFLVWVLRSTATDPEQTKLSMDGHIFTDHQRAQQWLEQRYVRDHYKLEERVAKKRVCSCGSERIVLI
jgi:hypothetical protein